MFRRVLRLLNIILILIFLLQSSPLRACVLQGAVIGSGCDDAACIAIEHPSPTPIDGCSATCHEDHGPTCSCEKSTIPGERAARVTHVPVLDIPVLILPFDNEAVRPWSVSFTRVVMTSPPPLARCTPLVL
ncbi:MAG: hypothetical protein QM770_01430 [Tepidisphaeraceae bacterium]